MTEKETLIKRYIAGTLSKQEIDSLESVRRTDKETDLLLDIIKACKEKARPKLKPPKRQQELNQNDIEVLLMRLLTFNIKKQDAALLLNQLHHAPHFLDKLRPTLSVATTPFSDDEEDLTMQSDEQILQHLLDSSKAKKATIAEKIKKSWQRFWDNLPIPEKNWVGGPAVAFAVILLFLTVHTILDNPARSKAYKIYFASDSAYISRGFDLSPQSTLRGGGTGSDKGPNHKLSDIALNLDIAREFYRDKDFKEALALLNSLSPQIESIASLPEATEIRSQFYFYYGMTHLGLAGGKVFYKSYIKKAVQYLKVADDIIFTGKEKHQDDVVFFLSYAYTLLGDERTAAAYASMIPKDSPFYKSEP